MLEVVSATLVDDVIQLCRQAGAAIKAIYQQEDAVEVTRKADDSPVTQADFAAHEILIDGLKRMTPEVPVLSEEEQAPAFVERSQWSRYWLVDPLDGTKEFLARTGEFTINVAFIEKGQAVLGVIYVPMEDVAYGGIVADDENVAAWKVRGDQKEQLAVRQIPQDSITVLTSSRHRGEQLAGCIQQLEKNFATVEWLKAGSALKFCRVAEGQGDLYPRFSPCCEWDTAAGQVVLEAAGGQLLDMDFKPLRYNQKDSLISPHFYAVGAANVDWLAILKPLE